MKKKCNKRLIIPFSSLETPLGTIRQALSSQTGLEPKAFKLLHAGAVMKDDSAPLSAYGIRNGSRVALIDGAANAIKEKPEKKEKARPTTEEGTIAVIKDELTKVNDRLVPALDIFLQNINPTGTTVTTTEPLSSTQDGNATKTISQPSSLSIPTPSRQSSLSTGAISDIDMEHRRLGEELLQSLLRLDIIALDGAWTSARAERKAAVKAVQALLDRLDSGWRARKERLQTGA